MTPGRFPYLLYYVRLSCHHAIAAGDVDASSWRTRHCATCGRYRLRCPHAAAKQCAEPEITDAWVASVSQTGARR